MSKRERSVSIRQENSVRNRKWLYGAVFAAALLLLAFVSAEKVKAAEVSISSWDAIDGQSSDVSYSLSNDITADTGEDIIKNVTIDLNGHSIKATGSEVFFVKNGGNLTIKDSSNGGTGTIISNANSDPIIMIYGGSCTLNGGTITHASGKKGTGVKLLTGTFTMSGGIITGNSAGKEAGGGGYINANGGGVHMEGGTFTMSGGEISNNGAVGKGGGVYMEGGTFTMSGGTISGNTAANGAGVYVDADEFGGGCGELTVTGGTVSGNPYGIYHNGTLKLQGNPTISKIYLCQGKTITITGALSNTDTIPVEKAGTTGPITTGYSTGNSGAAPSTYFSAKGDDYGVFLVSSEACIKSNSYPLTASITGWTYGSPNDPAVTGLPDEVDKAKVTYKYYTDAACQTETTAENSRAAGNGQQPKDAGTYYLKASVEATGGYKAAASAAVSFTISKKTINNIAGITAQNKVYDGTTDGTIDTSNASAEGLIQGDGLQVTVTGARFENKNAGNNKKIIFEKVQLEGDLKKNYELGENVQADTTANITKKSLSVSGIKAKNKTYDGKRDAALDVSQAVYDGKVNGDTLSLSGVGTFADANVGTGITVAIAGITLGGADAGNYSLTNVQTSSAANITAKSLEGLDLTISPDTFWYDGETKTVTYYLSYGNTRLTGGTDFTEDASSVLSEKEIGNYAIKLTGKGNYTGSISGSWKIDDSIGRSITTKDKKVTYKGKTVDVADMFTIGSDLKSASYSIASGGTGVGSLSGSKLTITKAGTIPITASAVTDDKQTKSATATLTVKKGKGSASITVASVTYGGKISPSISSDTNQSAAGTVTYTASGSTTASSTAPTAAGVYTATVSYEATDLYKAASASTSFQISPAVLTVKAEDNTKVLGQKDPELTYTATGFAGSDTKAKVMTGKLERASGDKAGKYAITQGTLAATANYTISFQAGTFTIIEIKQPAAAAPAETETASPVSEPMPEPAVVEEVAEEPEEEPEITTDQEKVDPSLQKKVVEENEEVTPVERFSGPLTVNLDPKPKGIQPLLVVLIVLLCAAGILVVGYLIITRKNRSKKV